MLYTLPSIASRVPYTASPHPVPAAEYTPLAWVHSEDSLGSKLGD